MEISVYLEQGIGEKGEINMNRKKTIYTEAPESVSRAIMEGERISDFLPPPEELVRIDYTEWRKTNLCPGMTADEISDAADRYCRENP